MNVLLVSGGSGGHLIPAMALADYLQADDRCAFVSTRRPVDRILASSGSSAGGDWSTVELERFTPLWRWLSPRYAARQARAVGQVWSVFARTKPDVVVGFGGYLSAVGLLAARRAGIPAVLHEQNVLPGKANRWLCRLADAVAVSFPETREHLPAGAAVEVTGNPVRFKAGPLSVEKARGMFGFDRERPVLLIMGGSQGSQAINRLILEVWSGPGAGERGKVQVLHVAGPGQADAVGAAYRELGMDSKVFPFLQEMEAALSAATLAVSRAGATGIAEMTAMGLPAILIPYPYAAGHQRANARWMESAGGAVVLEEEGLSAAQLWSQAQGLLWNLQRLARMREALAAKADSKAAERLGQLVRHVAKNRYHFRECQVQ